MRRSREEAEKMAPIDPIDGLPSRPPTLTDAAMSYEGHPHRRQMLRLVLRACQGREQALG